MSVSSPAPDLDLFEAWRNGDRRSGTVLFGRHIDSVRRFFSSRVRHDVEDLTQRTFLACEESKGSIRGDSSFRTFLFAVARNVLGKYFRSNRRHGDRTGPCDGARPDPAPSSSAVMAMVDEREGLQHALSRIPSEHRRVLTMYYLEQRTSADVARRLGIPHGTVRTRIRRARSLLREEVQRFNERMDTSV